MGVACPFSYRLMLDCVEPITTASRTQPTSSNQYKPQILTKVTRLGKDIADTFRDRYQEIVDNPAITVDSKLKREIEAKKKGQRLSM